MRKEIYLKNYDQSCFGVKLHTIGEFNGKFFDGELITEIFVNDDNDRSDTKQFNALTEALYELIENHEGELIKLYNEKLAVQE